MGYHFWIEYFNGDRCGKQVPGENAGSRFQVSYGDGSLNWYPDEEEPGAEYYVLGNPKNVAEICQVLRRHISLPETKRHLLEIRVSDAAKRKMAQKDLRSLEQVILDHNCAYKVYFGT